MSYTEKRKPGDDLWPERRKPIYKSSGVSVKSKWTTWPYGNH